MASRRVEQVLNGIQNLTDLEKAELARELSGTTRSGRIVTQESLSESFREVKGVHTAPIGQGGCACCGR